MAEFVEAAAGFPTVLFTSALVVVIGFWLLVLLGAADSDSFDADVDTDALSLGGVPVAVSVSLVIALAWFASFTGSVLLARTGMSGALFHLLGAALLVASLIFAWRMTRLLVRPLAKLFPDEPGPSRQDFVGLTCTIRTGRVDADFGQAEVVARDGSTAVVQVRQTGTDALPLGSTGLLYAYDDAGEFFWVAPYDTALDPCTAA
ncbi:MULTISPECIES: hypothetical protein [unclassified Streptomyces]|uniref:hypothetical protein n=1 Tax=unclassified Streptomyces TaxID=2593676 RepID=UPI002DDB7D5C|nr:hypothetical protein [Streptomyces sp. NBC_01750]WSB02217.1 YqiJ family protein [Streptomyces sp. NBC_01794]WSD33529.1 YqiJ family protein [Streptomyces sp. NBC_01750]